MSLEVVVMDDMLVEICDIDKNGHIDTIEVIIWEDGLYETIFLNKQQAYAIINELKKQFGEENEKS